MMFADVHHWFVAWTRVASLTGTQGAMSDSSPEVPWTQFMSDVLTLVYFQADLVQGNDHGV